MKNIVRISNLCKTYKGGFEALKDINLDIKKGEIFALLGPNGAGKTTLIGAICGVVNPTSGKVLVDGHDNIEDYRSARSLIGLVPQELTDVAFETVWSAVCFTRGLYGKRMDTEYIENLLKTLSLWEKKDSRVVTLSGGMKRRVLIAKALAHQPAILFLDEPTASLDVNLRKHMWEHVQKLRASGVTIILTTHYIEEAEEIADRIGIINDGKIILVEEKNALMGKLGVRQLIIELKNPLKTLPNGFSDKDLVIDGSRLIFSYDPKQDANCVEELLNRLHDDGVRIKGIDSKNSTLEDIFVKVVNDA